MNSERRRAKFFIAVGYFLIIIELFAFVIGSNISFFQYHDGPNFSAFTNSVIGFVSLKKK